MVSLTSVIEERGTDWDVRQDYEILGKSEDFPGNVVIARDVRTSGLPVLLRSIILTQQHAQEMMSCYTMLREASLRSPYIGDIYRLILHRRAEGPQLIVASEPPQNHTLSTLIKQWTDTPASAPPTMDDAQILHTAVCLLEALHTLEEAGFPYRNVHPEAIGVGNRPPWTFPLPLFGDFPVPGAGGMSKKPQFLPAFARDVDYKTLSQEQHCAVDLYGLGTTLFNLRTWALWKDAGECEGLSDAALLELNKFRVGEPLRKILGGLMGVGKNPPEFTNFEDARAAAETAFWKVAAEKGGAGLPISPLQQQVETGSAHQAAQDSLVLLEDLELWDRAPTNIQDNVIKAAGDELGDAYKWLRTETFAAGGLSHRIAIFEHCHTGMEMNLIPGGLYERGCGHFENEMKYFEKFNFESSSSYLSQETPASKVIIQPMLIGRFPVLCPEWDKMAKGGKVKKDNKIPVVEIPFDDVQTRITEFPGGLRMPSEAEWEYACRSGTNTRFFWGDEMDDSYCWNSRNSGGEPMDVMAHESKTNAFGLVDMLGNVLEWCQDHFVERYLDAPKDHQPFILANAETDHPRVIRGGCGWYGAPYCRSSSRAAVRSPKRKKRGDPPPAFEILGWRAVRSFN
jgi:formylglycine-generating enzyme required for sulfatase activity